MFTHYYTLEIDYSNEGKFVAAHEIDYTEGLVSYIIIVLL